MKNKYTVRRILNIAHGFWFSPYIDKLVLIKKNKNKTLIFIDGYEHEFDGRLKYLSRPLKNIPSKITPKQWWECSLQLRGKFDWYNQDWRKEERRIDRMFKRANNKQKWK